MNIDAPPVNDGTEALVLMLHHLRLAAMYFEATPEEYPHSYCDEDFSRPAIRAWVTNMEALYPKD